MSGCRVRFAPSPTGHLHIGGARTALFNYLFAKRHNGTFILRIEDTDLERSSQESEKVIVRDLQWLGIHWDEGIDAGGECGPYRSTERKDIYQKFVDRLLEEGKAYYCYCTEAELEEERKMLSQKGEMPRYLGKCRSLTSEQIEKSKAEGRAPSIRFRVPDGETITVHDLVRGEVKFESSGIGDFIIVKSAGMPVYNLAVVIDDYLMSITHVIRGEEHLSNTPRQILIYQALGLPIPEFAHVSLILGEDRSKMSKRHGDTWVEQYRDIGYLPEAIINFLALLGWSPKDEQEIFSMKDLEERFELEDVSRNPAVFDVNKLRWMNGLYIRKMGLERFHERALPYYVQVIHRDVDLMALSQLLLERTEIFSEIPQMIDFVQDLPEYNVELYVHKKMKTDLKNSLENLKKAYDVLAGLETWDQQSIHDSLMNLVAQMGVKNGQVLWPVRTALSGKEFTPGGAIETAVLLGRDESLRRIQIGIEKLSKG